jgi:hypothetical protein
MLVILVCNFLLCIFRHFWMLVFTHDPPHDIPDKGPSPHPIMEQIHINDKGVLNLLNNLKYCALYRHFRWTRAWTLLVVKIRQAAGWYSRPIKCQILARMRISESLYYFVSRYFIGRKDFRNFFSLFFAMHGQSISYREAY